VARMIVFRVARRTAPDRGSGGVTVAALQIG
jgi:hypothetical protein